MYNQLTIARAPISFVECYIFGTTEKYGSRENGCLIFWKNSQCLAIFAQCLGEWGACKMICTSVYTHHVCGQRMWRNPHAWMQNVHGESTFWNWILRRGSMHTLTFFFLGEKHAFRCRCSRDRYIHLHAIHPLIMYAYIYMLYLFYCYAQSLQVIHPHVIDRYVNYPYTLERVMIQVTGVRLDWRILLRQGSSHLISHCSNNT